MAPTPNSPDSHRNRIGCFVILGILALFVALYLLVSFHAKPGNNVAENIQAVPAAPAQK